MNEKINLSSKQKITKNIDNTDKNKRKNFKDNYFYKCCFNCFSSLNKKIKNCFFKCSITSQFIYVFVPLAHIVSFFLIFFHIYIFDSSFEFDYYLSIKNELLKYLITDIGNVNFELNNIEIKGQFDNLENLLFFRLYYEELMSFGLLDGDKIFPNISNLSETFYDVDNKILLSENVNSIFSIPSNLSKIYIDDRNDSLSELAKIYYSFYPIISFETYSINIYVNQTYLIAYEIDDNDNIIGNELYFNFPREKDDFIKNDNFHAYNNFISPLINFTIWNNTNELNESFYTENWFIKQDYNFRKLSNFLSILMNFLHLNINHEGKVNKTCIITMQTSYKFNKGRKLIINLIMFINQNKLKKDQFDYTLFMINNISRSLSHQKYSDNKTFVISQNDIIEIALCSLITHYFHYGLTSNDYNFYRKGIFYDNLDLNYLSEPTRHYSTIKGLNLDIRQFSSFYLFTKLFQKIPFTKNFSEQLNTDTFTFKDKYIIYDICSKYNFNLYKYYLNQNKINCWDRKDNELPYCICIPLYCIKNNEKNFDPDKIEFVVEMILPDKCQNNLKFYKNQIVEKNLNKENRIDSSVKYNFIDTINDQFEDEFIKFSLKKFSLIEGISFVLISIIDNYTTKLILTILINDINKIRDLFIIITTCGLGTLIIIIYILIIVNIYKISKVIYKFKGKFKLFVMKLEKKATNLSNKRDILKTNKEDEITSDNINNPEVLPLLKNEFNENNYLSNLKNNLNDDYNSLIDELFTIYCYYYKIKDIISAKDYKKNQIKTNTSLKIKELMNNNELFRLFCLISLYTPKINLEIHMDFDFYKYSDLMNNFLKSIKKKYLTLDEEQILYSKSIISELLSTEMVGDYGFITNLNFNYYTNINLKSKEKLNSIQKAIFEYIEDNEKKEKKNNLSLLVDSKDNITIKLMKKDKNIILKNIEENFEQDDYLQLKKLESYFNSLLINGFYNHSNRILINKK